MKNRMHEQSQTCTIDSLDAVAFLMAIEEIFELADEEVPGHSHNGGIYRPHLCKVVQFPPQSDCVAMLNEDGEKAEPAGIGPTRVLDTGANRGCDGSAVFDI